MKAVLIETLQLAASRGLAGPVFRLLDAIDPRIVESASHERSANAGRVFIEHASAVQKALFVAKLLFSYGVRDDRLSEIADALGVTPPTPDAAPDGEAMEVIFLGDLLYVEELGFASLSEALRARLARADRLVINLEGVVGERGNELYPFPSRRGFAQLASWNDGDGSDWVIRFARQQLAELLSGLPPVAFTLANNHTLDEGVAGAERTARLLEGIAEHVGCWHDVRHDPSHHGRGPCNAGASVIDVGNLRMGLLAMGFGHNHQPGRRAGLTFASVPYRLPAELDDAARALEGAHFRTAALHWGYEHEHWPRPDQIRCVRELWKRGFHAVIGHHPHLMQPSVSGAGGGVAFSLGDFVGGDRTVFSRFSHAISLRFDARGRSRMEAIPLVQTPFVEPQRTSLLAESSPFDRRCWEGMFAPKLRSLLRVDV